MQSIYLENFNAFKKAMTVNPNSMDFNSISDFVSSFDTSFPYISRHVESLNRHEVNHRDLFIDDIFNGSCILNHSPWGESGLHRIKDAFLMSGIILFIEGKLSLEYQTVQCWRIISKYTFCQTSDSKYKSVTFEEISEMINDSFGTVLKYKDVLRNKYATLKLFGLDIYDHKSKSIDMKFTEEEFKNIIVTEQDCEWNLENFMQRTGYSDRTFYRLLKKYGIKLNRKQKSVSTKTKNRLNVITAIISKVESVYTEEETTTILLQYDADYLVKTLQSLNINISDTDQNPDLKISTSNFIKLLRKQYADQKSINLKSFVKTHNPVSDPERPEQKKTEFTPISFENLLQPKTYKKKTLNHKPLESVDFSQFTNSRGLKQLNVESMFG